MTIQALHSDVILHVPDAVYGIILGNILTDHWRFRHLVRKKDCIISPICEFHFHGSTIEPKPMFRLLIPHTLRNIKKTSRYVQVKFQMKEKAVLHEAKHLTSEDRTISRDVLYKIHRSYVEILTRHFTKFFVTAKEIECCGGSCLLKNGSGKQSDNCRYPYLLCKSSLRKNMDYLQVMHLCLVTFST